MVVGEPVRGAELDPVGAGLEDCDRVLGNDVGRACKCETVEELIGHGSGRGVLAALAQRCAQIRQHFGGDLHGRVKTPDDIEVEGHFAPSPSAGQAGVFVDDGYRTDDDAHRGACALPRSLPGTPGPHQWHHVGVS